MRDLQLSELGIYYLHSVDETAQLEGTLKAINELHKQGMFKCVRRLLCVSMFVLGETAVDTTPVQAVWVVELLSMADLSDLLQV